MGVGSLVPHILLAFLNAFALRSILTLRTFDILIVFNEN